MKLHSVPDRPRRAIGYVRVSMAREEMISPELQRATIETHCAQRGYVLDDVIEDLDRTGRNFARAGVQDAIARVERGEADVIVVWKVSRFGRNRRDWHVHADRVELAGGALESATEAYDPRTSTGRLTRGMLVELAAWESDVKSEQWKEAQRHRISRGLPHTMARRFGYRVVDGAYEIDPEEGPLLAECYRRYAAGETPRRISDWLNSVGSRTTQGTRWTANTLRPMLQRGFGAGFLYVQGQLVPGAHEAVIDQKTWRAFEDRRRRVATEPPRTRKGVRPLTGLVVCQRCGQPMRWWEGINNGRAYGSYRCFAGGGGCGRNYIGIKRLLAEVKSMLAEVADDLDAAAAAKAVPARTVSKVERAIVSSKIAELEKSLDRLTDGYSRGVVPEASYMTVRAELMAEREGLEHRLAQLVDDVRARPSRPVARRILRDFDLLLAEDPAGLKEVLRALLLTIVVWPGRDVDPKAWVIPRWETFKGF